ncbi:DUF1385 domain-containing protein [Cohnella rhizoplanae]|uniref:DUF1385 domain-containing protein n=1 Tax=Cohnella rhizoplanae TaxID=2974897 RepID=UPI003D7C2FF6
MFAGRNVHVTAVRRKNQEIAFFEVPRKQQQSRALAVLKRIPFIRGIVGIIESSAKGSQHLNFSAEAYAEDETPADEAAKPKEKEKWSLSMVLGVAVVGVLSFVFGKLVFTTVPALLEGFLFDGVFSSMILHNILEGVIKIALLLFYLWFISKTPLIKRLFQYHGAEHKVISAYEAGVELTVENVQRFTRLHYRCGSSFLVFTVIVGVVLYSFPIFHWDTIWERVWIRIALLPVVIGISYEVLRWTNAARDIPGLRILGYPGLWLQLLTTKEPNDDQVAVSIASFNRMRELDREIRPV